MTGPVGGAAGTGPAPPRDDDARLRQATRQLAGLFAQQLFKAMRATVPQDEGVVNGGSGEEMFTGMLDEHIAGAGPARPAAAGATDGPGTGAVWTRALADAMYQRMRPHAVPAPDAPAAGAPALGAPTVGAPAAGGVTSGGDRASLHRPTGFALPPAAPAAAPTGAAAGPDAGRR